MNFCVIIPTLNRPNILEETLNSIKKQSVQPGKVLVIDQSNDNSTKKVCEKFSFARYIHTDEKSSAKARNIGIDNSEEDIIFFLDDDVELMNDYFKIILNTYLENEHAAAVQGWIVNSHTFGKFSNMLRKFFMFEHTSAKMELLPNFLGTNFKNRPEEITEIKWCNGCGFSARNIYAKKELFEGNFILYSLAEDRDFSYRISKLGTILMNPDAEMVHKVVNIGRLPNEKKTLMTYVHQMYLISKNFGWKPLNSFSYWWNIFGRLLTTSVGILRFDRTSFLTAKHNWKSFFYVVKYGRNIRNLDISDFNSKIVV